MVTDNIFPSRLREIMKERHVTQTALGSFLGVKRQTISLYEIGRSSPDVECVANIAEYFGVTADWLLGLSDAKTRDTTVQSVSAYTGLPESVIEALHNEKDAGRNEMQDFIEYLVAYHQKKV